MEENKVINEAQKPLTDAEKIEKLTRDCNQLNNIAIQLSQQNEALDAKNKQLIEALNNADKAEFFTTMNMAFRAIEFKDSFSPEFIANCVKHIESTLIFKDKE